MRSSSVQQEGGAALLQELEALSQALYKSQSRDSSAEIDVASRRRASEVVVSRNRNVHVKQQDGRHSISAAINPAANQLVDSDDSKAEWLEENLAFSQSLEAPLAKRSLWDWKPLRALAHIGQQRFGCEFSAHVQGIEKLSSSMNGLRLQVHLQHKDSGVHTTPVRVSHGSVEFEETMQFQCTIYGSKKSNGSIKYMSKAFSLFVVAPDAPELDLGKHKLDLTRILPSTTSSKLEGNNVWNTSFKLSGKAKGAALWVTFSYEFLDGSNQKGLKFAPSPATRRLGAGSGLRSFSSLPSSPQVSVFSATRKKNASVDFESPISEPAEWSLDDSPPKQEVKSAVDATSSSGSLDSRGPPLFYQLGFSAASVHPGRPGEIDQSKSPVKAEDEGPDDFKVVEKGVESRPLEQSEEVVDYKGDESAEEEQEVKVICLENSAEQQQQQEINIHDLSEEEEQDIDQEVIVVDLSQDQQGVANYAEEEQAIINCANEAEQEETTIEQEYLVNEDEPEDKVVDQGQVAEEEQQEFTVLDHEYSNEEEEEEDDEAQEHKAAQVEQDVAKYDWKEADELDGLQEVLQEQKLEEVQLGAYESSDDEVDVVAGEFLHMLEEGGPSSDEAAASPKAMLLKQFESETGFELALDTEDDEQPAAKADNGPLEEAHMNQAEPSGVGWSSDEDKDLAAIMDAAESELQKAAQAMRSRARAKMLEDAEAEALLQEWGLNEKAFQASSPKSQIMNSADSELISNSLVVRQELPPLAPGIGSVVPTSDGGSLRSMNSALFQAANNNGQLVMHVSKPVVVPAETGSSAMEVLQTLASAGTGNMTAQAMQAMPLEDITGKSVQQIAMEGQACFEESRQRYNATLNALEYQATSSNYIVARNSNSGIISAEEMRLGKERQQASTASSSDFLSLDELAPVAMEKIEALALQGLKVQCNMAEEEAPYAIEPGASNRQMLEAGDGQSSEGMIAMSLSLDEWMRLDAGLDSEEENNERTQAVLAAHGAAHSTTTDLILNLGDEQSQKGPGKLGDTLTLAMLVQLRDPLRNYEPVGAPMMALVEAERVLLPPKPRLYKRVGLKGDSYREDEDEAEEAERKQLEPQFKITGVHMAGLSTNEESKKASSNLWGSAKQQQSGSRWLIASGMAKAPASTTKHPLLKSKQASSGGPGARSTPKQSSSDSLWSISSRLTGSGGWGSSRNPDVKFGARFRKR